MKYLSLTIILFFTNLVEAQKISISYLNSNSVLSQQTPVNYRTKSTSLSLPFFDDFNYKSVYPDPNRWTDNFAYINNEYAIAPPTIGVATLEGLNPLGKPYSLNNNVPGFADKLTSQPIDLSALNVNQSIWLSFFYEAKGRGDAPFRFKDKLYVDFKDSAQVWNTVWITEMNVLDTFIQVFLPFNDTKYLHSDFQFRFRNFGTLAGNADHWHIDYVKLDKDRDTIVEKNIADLAYIEPPKSIFQPYYVLPYNQIDSTYYASSNSIKVRNNFNLPTTDFIDFFEAELLNDNSILTTYSGPSVDLSPIRTYIQSYPEVNLPQGLTADTVAIKLKYEFITSAENGADDVTLANNKLEHILKLSNFFAYDDGTAELGFNIEDNSSNVDIAMQFENIVPDTLRALRLHLSSIIYPIEDVKFDLLVWKGIQLGGTIDTILYQENDISFGELRSRQEVVFNEFYYKEILESLNNNQPLIIEGKYFVGIRVRANNKVVIGFDANNDAKNYMYYKLPTGWERSVFNGALMINPVFGKTLPWQLTPTKFNTVKNIDVYPNPTEVWLHLPKNITNFDYEIFDMIGTKIESNYSNNNIINVQNLTTGFYVLRINANNEWFTTKFIKQ